MPSNVFTLTTAYRWSSIALVTKGTAPQREQTKKSAVAVPNLLLRDEGRVTNLRDKL